MTERDTDTDTPDTLAPDAFSPAGAAPDSEQLAATAFEPLNQSSQQKKRLNVTQIALGVVGVVPAPVLGDGEDRAVWVQKAGEPEERLQPQPRPRRRPPGPRGGRGGGGPVSYTNIPAHETIAKIVFRIVI